MGKIIIYINVNFRINETTRDRALTDYVRILIQREIRVDTRFYIGISIFFSSIITVYRSKVNE